MKKFYFLLTSAVLLVATQVMAQTYHNIDVADFSFSPSQLTINVGDTVLWSNSLGFHNINGNLIDHPENPDSFGNATGPAGWTYEFVFTIPGSYSYNCDVHEAMNGSITVVGNPNGIAELENHINFDIYPNPVSTQLSWKCSDRKSSDVATMNIYDITGKSVDSFLLNGFSTRDVSNFAEGLYTFVIVQENSPVQFGKILVIR